MLRAMAIAVYVAAGLGLALSFDDWRQKNCGKAATALQKFVIVSAYPLLGVAAITYGVATPKEERAPACGGRP